MKTFIKALLCSLLLQPALVYAQLNVFTCEPEWASLVKELGGDKVKASSATTAYQDPHHIEARPSLIARLRRADLLVCTGAELEIGWLPLLLRQAANTSVVPGQKGYFEAAMQVERLDIPQVVDRSMGDVHASGNPHIHLDPRRVLTVAEKLSARLSEVDPMNRAYYQSQYARFKQRWESSITHWKKRAKPLQGLRVVTHHRDYVYLFDWLGIEVAGTLEPRPGMPTTAAHLSALKTGLSKQPAQYIVHTPYQNPRAANRLSSLVDTPVVELPYTVTENNGIADLFALFDVIIKRLKGNET